MEVVMAAIEAVDARIKAKDELEAERRKTDDIRYERLAKNQETIIERTDKHGLRTTALETLWSAFFGDQGAFKIVVKNQEDQGKKIDRLSWGFAIGIGLLMATQFWLTYGHPK